MTDITPLDKTTINIAPSPGRRAFLHKAAVGAAALTLPGLPHFSIETAMGIVVHSYGFRWNSKVESSQYPAFHNALDLLNHSQQIGAGGIQVVVKDWTSEFAKELRKQADKYGMYIEGSIALPKGSADSQRFERELMIAREAGIVVQRTVCSSGRRYENYHSQEAFTQLQKDALASLRLAEPILRKHKIKLGIENHKDWRADELVAMLHQLKSEWIGVTLDFGNSIALLEDPMEVITTLAPYSFSTHVKDMGVEEYPDGFLLSEVAMGKGVIDLPKIFSICKKHNPSISFNLEMITRDPLEIPCLKDGYWETFNGVKGIALAKTLRMVRQHKYAIALPRISHLSGEERLAAEEQNILACMAYSKQSLAKT